MNCALLSKSRYVISGYLLFAIASAYLLIFASPDDYFSSSSACSSRSLIVCGYGSLRQAHLPGL